MVLVICLVLLASIFRSDMIYASQVNVKYIFNA